MFKKLLLLLVLYFGCVAIFCFAATHDPWDGTKWDVTSPDIDQPHGNDYKEIYDLRKGVALRVNREHVTLATSSAGGWHLNGSGMCYEGTAEPPNLPDDSAALSNIARDRGRLWLDDNFGPPVLKRWDGSAWEEIGTIVAMADKAIVYIHNIDHQNTNGGRDGCLRFRGEKTDGTVHSLVEIRGYHTGTGDDQKGKLGFFINDGDDSDAPSKGALVIKETGKIDVSTSLMVLDEDDMASNDAEVLATQQSIKAHVASGTVTMTNKTLTSPVLNTGLSGTAFLDEDNMASDSATKAASQQSIKAYVDGITDPAYSGGESHTFEGGLIIKMGYTAIGATSGTVTFASAFPNAVVSVSTGLKNAAAGTHSLMVTDFTTADIDWAVGDSGYTGFYWQAIGY